MSLRKEKINYQHILFTTNKPIMASLIFTVNKKVIKNLEKMQKPTDILMFF